MSFTPFLLEFVWKRNGLMTVNHCLPGVSGGADAPSDAQSLLRHDRHEPGAAKQAKQCTCSKHDCYAWLMCSKTYDPDKHRKCSDCHFPLTKRAQGYLFDVLKVIFFKVNNMFALCIYVRVHVVLPMSGAKQIGGLDLKNNQWTPRVHCWEGVISLILFVHLHTWFEYVWILTSYNASGVDVGCALSCMEIVAYAKSLQDNWGRQKAVVLTDRCEKIEPLRLHPWIGRFGHAFMQAVASICFRPALFFQGSALGSWANASRV